MDENEYASIQEARNRASKMYETMETGDPGAMNTGRRTTSLKVSKCNTAPLQMGQMGQQMGQMGQQMGQMGQMGPVGRGTAERKVSQYRYSEDSSDTGSNRQYFVVDTTACRDASAVESRYSN